LLLATNRGHDGRQEQTPGALKIVKLKKEVKKVRKMLRKALRETLKFRADLKALRQAKPKVAS
jgi:hypothetical protein